MARYPIVGSVRQMLGASRAAVSFAMETYNDMEAGKIDFATGSKSVVDDVEQAVMMLSTVRERLLEFQKVRGVSEPEAEAWVVHDDREETFWL